MADAGHPWHEGTWMLTLRDLDKVSGTLARLAPLLHQSARTVEAITLNEALVRVDNVRASLALEQYDEQRRHDASKP